VAIGARCQTANTYLENKLEEMDNASTQQLIKWAIEAMKKAQDLEISPYNIAVSVVGKGQEYKILSSEEVEPYIKGNGMEVV
jgi:20S proteasome alpha/beta subunit